MANVKGLFEKYGVGVAAGLVITGMISALTVFSNSRKGENTTHLNVSQESITRLTEEIAKNPIVDFDTLYDAQGNIKEIKNDTTYVLSNQDFKDLEQVRNDINALEF